MTYRESFLEAEKQLDRVLDRNAEYHLAEQMADDYLWQLIHEQQDRERAAK